MKFRFVLYYKQTDSAFAGARDLLSAERLAEYWSKDFHGAFLVLDTQSRLVVASAEGGDLNFSPRHKYPL